MKKFYLFVLSFFVCSLSFASPINDNVNNGYWKNSTTWDKNRKPKDGDTVIIPAGKTVIVNSWEILNNVCIKVYGTLKFSGAFTALELNSSSKVVVYTNASIEATIDYLQYVLIGGSYVFYLGTIDGPVVGTSSGFTGFSPLPVKFVGFTVTHKNNDALIQWSTSNETNANSYEIERSLDGNNWNTIAYVIAVGNSINVNNYSFTDKNLSAKIAYYRVKEVDFDGKTTITDIKSIKTDITSTIADIKISSIQNKVLLQFPLQVQGNLIVRFVSLNGQIVDQQNINNPVGQVVLNSKVTGNYIISVSNGQDINAARQVIL
jgi:protein involved in ribonucleotide reduction